MSAIFGLIHLNGQPVAAMAVQHRNDKGCALATFTETPRPGFTGLLVSGRYADETPFVRAMARRHPALRLNFVHSGEQLFTDGLTQMFEAAEIPFHNASNRMWVEGILREAQRQGLGVLMTGGSGNLTLSWRGDALLAQHLRDGQWDRLWAELRAVAGRRGVNAAGRAFVAEALLPLLPNAIHARMIPRHSRQESSPILAAFAEAQQVDARSRRRGSHLRNRPAANTRPMRLRSLLSGVRRGDGLMSGYQAMFGVTLADPTGDVRLVEFCLSLPEEQYRRAGVSRWLVRRAMADHLPEEILNNTQRGLQAAGWFKLLQRHQSQLREQLAFIAESDLARRALDLPRLAQLVERIDDAGDAKQRLSDYRQTLDRGLMLGRFIRWVELGQ